MKTLTIFQQHQKKIAIKILKTNPVFVQAMGGLTQQEAKSFLLSIGYTTQQIEKLSK
jgi:hypothetical protein